jgi:hypothetical protein
MPSAELIPSFRVASHDKPRSSRQQKPRIHGAGSCPVSETGVLHESGTSTETPLQTWIPNVPTLSPPESGTSSCAVAGADWVAIDARYCPKTMARPQRDQIGIAEAHMYQYEGTDVNVDFEDARSYVRVLSARRQERRCQNAPGHATLMDRAGFDHPTRCPLAPLNLPDRLPNCAVADGLVGSG